MQRMGDFTRMFIERGCGGRIELPLPRDHGRTFLTGVLEAHDHGSAACESGSPTVDARHRSVAGFDDAPLRGRQGRAPSPVDPLTAQRPIRAAAKERVGFIVLVGDAMEQAHLASKAAVRPRGRVLRPDEHSHRVFPPARCGARRRSQRCSACLPEALLFDGMGSTEGGMGASRLVLGTIPRRRGSRLLPTTKVFTEDGREVVPGSGEAEYCVRWSDGPARVLQGSREVGADVPGDPRRSILVPGRLGDRGTRWHPDPARLVGTTASTPAARRSSPKRLKRSSSAIDGVEDCLVLG